MRPKRIDIFVGVSFVVTLLVLLFIGSALLAIGFSGLTHLGMAVTSAEVLFSLRLSVITSAISTAVCVVCALPCSYVLTKTSFPFRRAIEVLIELTLSLPYILLGFALLIVFSSPFGKALKEAGFPVIFHPAGIVCAQMIVNLPFTIRMIRTAMADVNPRMEFVAQTLGASSWQVFTTIILPVCRNAIISATVLTWSRGMGEFGATLMLVGITRMQTETLPGSVYLNISTGDNEAAMATAIIILLVSAVTLCVVNALNKPVWVNRVRAGKKFSDGA